MRQAQKLKLMRAGRPAARTKPIGKTLWQGKGSG
jgi:hypothetical protein